MSGDQTGARVDFPLNVTIEAPSDTALPTRLGTHMRSTARDQQAPPFCRQDTAARRPDADAAHRRETSLSMRQNRGQQNRGQSRIVLSSRSDAFVASAHDSAPVDETAHQHRAIEP